MTDVLDRSPAVRGSPRTSQPDDTQGAPLIETMGTLLKHVRIMVLVPTVLFSLSVGLAWRRKEFVAQSRISPQSQESGLSGLMGMAAQLGVGVPSQGSKQNESVDFYADLVKSREVIDSLAITSFSFTGGTDDRDSLSGTYMDLNQIKGKTDFDRLYKARRRLEGKINVTVKRSSAILTVQVRAKWGRLAEQMNRRLIDLVNEFNLKRRQSAARAERSFIENRLVEVGTELRDAQASVRVFLERNRAYQDDPQLNLEAQNRSRKADELQQVYQNLATQFETARAEEIRDTPLITVVESPEGSRKRSSGVLMAGLFGMVAGVLLAAGLALTLEYLEAERRRQPEAYAAFRRSWSSLPKRFFGLSR